MKLQIEITSNNPPDTFSNWGGGDAAKFYNAGLVLDNEDTLYNVEVIQDLPYLHDIKISIHLSTFKEVSKKIQMQPQAIPLNFVIDGEYLKFELDKFQCHQMIEII